MTKKSRLTDLLHMVRDYQLELEGHLSQAERDEVGAADSWSAKDDMAHSMFWANFELGILEAHERGEAPPLREYEDFEDQNDVTFEDYKDASWDDVKAMVRGTYTAIDAYLDRVDEAVLLETPEGRPYPIWRDIAGSYIVHPAIHLWTYLENHGYGKLRSEILGDAFFEQMLALDDSEAWRGVNYYNMACNLALAGDSETAIKYLADALKLQPELVDWSKQDSDLDSLRDLPGYQALYNDQ